MNCFTVSFLSFFLFPDRDFTMCRLLQPVFFFVLGRHDCPLPWAPVRTLCLSLLWRLCFCHTFLHCPVLSVSWALTSQFTVALIWELFSCHYSLVLLSPSLPSPRTPDTRAFAWMSLHSWVVLCKTLLLFSLSCLLAYSECTFTSCTLFCGLSLHHSEETQSSLFPAEKCSGAFTSGGRQWGLMKLVMCPVLQRWKPGAFSLWATWVGQELSHRW